MHFCKHNIFSTIRYRSNNMSTVVQKSCLFMSSFLFVLSVARRTFLLLPLLSHVLFLFFFSFSPWRLGLFPVLVLRIVLDLYIRERLLPFPFESCLGLFFFFPFESRRLGMGPCSSPPTPLRGMAIPGRGPPPTWRRWCTCLSPSQRSPQSRPCCLGAW